MVVQEGYRFETTFLHYPSAVWKKENESQIKVTEMESQANYDFNWESL
jgi:hypothetical protein